MSAPSLEKGSLQLFARVLRERLAPSRGQRPGRPRDPELVLQRKVSMSEETYHQLGVLAVQVSDKRRKVSPMQVAALLLEEGLSRYGHTDQQESERNGNG